MRLRRLYSRAALPAAGLLAALAFSAMLLLPAGPARAIQLCLTNCTCSLSTAPIPFGNYNTLSGSPTLAVGSVTINCQILSLLGVTSLSLPVTVSLSAGSGSFASRKMTGPNLANLSYNLYVDSAMSQVWGNGTSGTQTPSIGLVLTLLAPSVSQSLTVYGQIPGGQNVRAGSYSDTVMATVAF